MEQKDPYEHMPEGIHPFKGFTPRQNPPKKENISPAELLSIPTLQELENMPRAALHLLLQQVFGARWGEIALMTKEQRREAATLKLWHGGLTEQDINKALPPLREAYDRDFGKAAQSVALDVKGSVEHTHTHEISSSLIKDHIQRILTKKPLVIEHGEK